MLILSNRNSSSIIIKFRKSDLESIGTIEALEVVIAMELCFAKGVF